MASRLRFILDDLVQQIELLKPGEKTVDLRLSVELYQAVVSDLTDSLGAPAGTLDPLGPDDEPHAMYNGIRLWNADRSR